MLHAEDENITFLCSTHPVITVWKTQLNSTNLKYFFCHILSHKIDHTDQFRGQKQLTNSSYWCWNNDKIIKQNLDLNYRKMCSISDKETQGSVLMHAVGRRESREKRGGGHSLQSCEKSLEGGKWKVGEEGLVTMAGAELMPLDTTEDAGT